MQRLGELMAVYTKFEYIGLAKNNIKSYEDIRPVIKQIGKIKLTPQMLEELHKKERER